MFNESYWNEWSDSESKNYQETGKGRRYLRKGYTHFDHRFWFPTRKDELKTLVANNLKIEGKVTDSEQNWAFDPFLRLLVKTPRYRYQELDDAYSLETKVRPICFASHMDSLILGYYSFALTKTYEKHIHSNGFQECRISENHDSLYS